MTPSPVALAPLAAEAWLRGHGQRERQGDAGQDRVLEPPVP
ncbi:hypothetical protein [Nonomuraea rubra]